MHSSLNKETQEIQEIYLEKKLDNHAVSLAEKYDVSFECLTDLLKHLNLDQINSLLYSIDQSAGSKKATAQKALLKALKTLEKIEKDIEKNVSILSEIAEIAEEDAGAVYEALAKPKTARSLFNALNKD